ncbi:hypothetical protein OKW35_000050 [Paraburkholderia sp. MM5477-R1]
MRKIFNQSGIQIIDDVLAPHDLAVLTPWAERLTYRGVHIDRWRSVWRLGDGEPLRGPTWLMSRVDAVSRHGLGVKSCPAELEPLAAVLRVMFLDGNRSSARASLTPWIYPPGTALGLHRDDGDLDGSYIFYFSRDWDVHWGGLLHCMVEPANDSVPARAILNPDEERKSVCLAGPGIWVSPAPNRLVILDSYVRHFISRVDSNAGDRPRLTISGFAHRPI